MAEALGCWEVHVCVGEKGGWGVVQMPGQHHALGRVSMLKCHPVQTRLAEVDCYITSL